MNILVITTAKFPEGDAEALRLNTIGNILRDIGYNITFAGMGYSEYLEKYQYNGFDYVSLRKNSHTKFSRFYYYFDFKNRMKKYIQTCLKEKHIDAILFSDLSPFTISALKVLCKRKKIKLIVDSVEWYSPEQFKFGTLSAAMVLKNIENIFIIDQNIKVIAISKYLNSHFKRKGCDCVRIPAILDVKNIKFNKKLDEEKLSILYAGSPGKKDFIEEMLNGILLLTETEKKNLNFVFAGVSEHDAKKILSPCDFEKLFNCVEFLGRVDRRIVLQKLELADFTVLLRASEQRYAKAGFPTKIVESLSTATPVILNLSSDLGDYIRDMEEGLIVDSCTAVAFSETIKRALKLTTEQKELLRKNARICAENNFDYRLYNNILNDFITS